MTPLQLDILALQSCVTECLGEVCPDDLDSWNHVRLIGVFLEIYHIPEIMDQVMWLMLPASEGGPA